MPLYYESLFFVNFVNVDYYNFFWVDVFFFDFIEHNFFHNRSSHRFLRPAPCRITLTFYSTAYIRCYFLNDTTASQKLLDCNIS